MWPAIQMLDAADPPGALLLAGPEEDLEEDQDAADDPQRQADGGAAAGPVGPRRAARRRTSRRGPAPSGRGQDDPGRGAARRKSRSRSTSASPPPGPGHRGAAGRRDPGPPSRTMPGRCRPSPDRPRRLPKEIRFGREGLPMTRRIRAATRRHRGASMRPAARIWQSGDGRRPTKNVLALHWSACQRDRAGEFGPDGRPMFPVARRLASVSAASWPRSPRRTSVRHAPADSAGLRDPGNRRRWDGDWLSPLAVRPRRWPRCWRSVRRPPRRRRGAAMAVAPSAGRGRRPGRLDSCSGRGCHGKVAPRDRGERIQTWLNRRPARRGLSRPLRLPIARTSSDNLRLGREPAHRWKTALPELPRPAADSLPRRSRLDGPVDCDRGRAARPSDRPERRRLRGVPRRGRRLARRPLSRGLAGDADAAERRVAA